MVKEMEDESKCGQVRGQWTKEASWRPNVKLLHRRLKYSDSPTFLGVTFDRQLTFRKHVDKIKEKANKRLNVLRCLSGKSWGADEEDLRIVYLAYIKSAIDYASNAWYPCLAKDSRQKLETVQNAAARTITGCTKNTNTKLLLNEAKLLPLEVESTISQSAAYKRSLRLPETDPSRKTAENPVRTRLRSLGKWRETGKDKAYVCILEDFPREKLVPVPDIPPWQVSETFTCCSTLGEGISKADAPEELKKAVEDTMKKLNKPDVEVFTDGSARDGVFFLDGGILVIEKEERHSLGIAAGRYGSSYRAESMALKKALRWLQEREKEGTINLYTDSQSLVRRLVEGPTLTKTSLKNEMWTLIHQICSRNATNLHIQWIPGHCGIAGNDEADHLANQGQIEDQREVKIDLKRLKQCPKEMF
ncbi:ribonuclease H [Elysia marginata]|uniref:Ribonuclease H n=1 Tax=Elysia marginata TaxID=1093978 RepID=A0AAV4I116_9GAST|nr:ribonuclease H [Elysia marginata]